MVLHWSTCEERHGDESIYRNTVEAYRGYGIDLEAASGENHHLLPVPSVFIVGTDGRIAFAYANTDYTVRLSAEEMIEAAREAVNPN